MHEYRTHTCGQLRLENAGRAVRLSGWVHRKRDHGQLLFLDLRDHYGVTQCVVDGQNAFFSMVESMPVESVLSITGEVVRRSPETVNTEQPTGEIELCVEDIQVLSQASPLPFPVNQEAKYPEEMRLTYRYLDLRRSALHERMLLRSKVIASLRRRMETAGFVEYQTPILTASSPEGARDFLVPSRLHPGSFYALPQAPQQFKQLIMMAGFDRYYQIAPCFRDEDARADRSPGEFYQLDFEMSFVTQEDVLGTIEPILSGLFQEYALGASVTSPPFPRIPYHEALLQYGSDKPDLRNPLRITDVSACFQESGFKLFSKKVSAGEVVRSVLLPGGASFPRSFFDKLNAWAQKQGQPGLGYLLFKDEGGPIAKHLSPSTLEGLRTLLKAQKGDAAFFVCGEERAAASFAGEVRTHLAQETDQIDHNAFKFCWVVDFPLYERTEQGEITFSHNPFSMPQGGLEALDAQDPLTIKAFQYDIVCNGIELSSGAIRNHRLDIMYKAFALAGYDRAHVDAHFGGMVRALNLGAPPHGGCAPGVDRIVMLLGRAQNLRDVVMFPMNQMAQDLMMGAPNTVREEQLKEVKLSLDLSEEKSEE